MLVIPELKSVLILPPRSGSTATKKYVLEQYPQAFSPYRHGEYLMLNHVSGAIDAIEASDWTVLYMLRDPMERMKSLWRYMQEVSAERNPRAPSEWIRMQNEDAARPFNEWLLNSTELFNHAAHPATGSPEAYYSTFFQVPATQKGAKYFLRGCNKFRVIRFGQDTDYYRNLGFKFSDLAIDNASNHSKDAHVTLGCHDFIQNYHHADILLKGQL